MDKVNYERIENEEQEMAEQRAISRKLGLFDSSNDRRIFRNLIDAGVFRDPREERLKRIKQEQLLKNKS